VGKTIANILLFCLIGYQVLVINDNLRNKIVKPMLGMGEKYATYREFYAVEQFEQINKIIKTRSFDQPYKIASLGIHPAVAIFNGIPSIDGYSGIYGLKYKNKIFEIIEKELESESRYLFRHFMGWGNKCY